VIPDKPTDKLSNITPLKFSNLDYDLESSETELLAEMERSGRRTGASYEYSVS